jgi:hypothetical protein
MNLKQGEINEGRVMKEINYCKCTAFQSKAYEALGLQKNAVNRG